MDFTFYASTKYLGFTECNIYTCNVSAAMGNDSSCGADALQSQTGKKR